MKSSSPLSKNSARADAAATESAIYEIRIKGRLDGERWSAHFAGLELLPDDKGITILRGPIADQAALYGLLSRLRNLNLPLLSVNRLETPGDASL
jgi:hypothetical protein